MATNPLSTTFGNVEGEGWYKATLGAASAKITLPSQFNEECFIQVAILGQGTTVGSSWALFDVYNPGGTTTARRLTPGGVTTAQPTATGEIPNLVTALSNGTINVNHTIYFIKNADTGACDVRQTSSSTFTSATVMVRRVG